MALTILVLLVLSLSALRSSYSQSICSPFTYSNVATGFDYSHLPSSDTYRSGPYNLGTIPADVSPFVSVSSFSALASTACSIPTSSGSPVVKGIFNISKKADYKLNTTSLNCLKHAVSQVTTYNAQLQITLCPQDVQVYFSFYSTAPNKGSCFLFCPSSVTPPNAVVSGSPFVVFDTSPSAYTMALSPPP